MDLVLNRNKSLAEYSNREKVNSTIKEKHRRNS
jgi:hypothetical protein